MCCLQNDITIRIIGTLSLMMYVSVLIASSSHFPDPPQGEAWQLVLGFDPSCLLGWRRQVLDEIMGGGGLQGGETSLREGTGDEVLLGSVWDPVIIIGCSFVAAATSASLIWMSVTNQRWLCAPWLLTTFLHIGLQVCSLVWLFLGHLHWPSWLAVFTACRLVLTFYFLGTVLMVQRQWGAEETTWKTSQLSQYSNQEAWENIFRSPPKHESPYKSQV